MIYGWNHNMLIIFLSNTESCGSTTLNCHYIKKKLDLPVKSREILIKLTQD